MCTRRPTIARRFIAGFIVDRHLRPVGRLKDPHPLCYSRLFSDGSAVIPRERLSLPVRRPGNPILYIAVGYVRSKTTQSTTSNRKHKTLPSGPTVPPVSQVFPLTQELSKWPG